MREYLKYNIPYFLGVVIVLAAITFAAIHVYKPLSAQTPPAPQLPTPVSISLGEMYQVKGNSMFPALLPGDFVILPWGNWLKPQVGKIIAFNMWQINLPTPGFDFTVHRVIETGEDKDGWWARTKGDNMPEADPFLVRQMNYIGMTWGRVSIW